jgi:hypothetical protein
VASKPKNRGDQKASTNPAYAQPPEDRKTPLLLLPVRNRRTADRDTLTKKNQKGGKEV